MRPEEESGSCHPRDGPLLPLAGWGRRGTRAGVRQVHVAVGRSKVRLHVDRQKVAERPNGEAGSPPATGFMMLGGWPRPGAPGAAQPQ